MQIDYKGNDGIDRKAPLLEQKDESDLDESSYQNLFENLFDEEIVLVSDSILKLANLVDQDITNFEDCVAFTKVLEIADDPMFDNYMPVLIFFNSITSNSVHDEKLLAHFISPSFLSTLKNFLYINEENPDFFKILFNIYGNIIYCSELFSQQILSIQFLSRLYEIIKNLPQTSDYFIDLLGCILLRFKVLLGFSIDPFPKISELITFFFSSDDFVLLSNTFTALVQASSISFPSFVKSFFTPFIVEKVIDILQWQAQFDCEDIIQIDIYNIQRESFFSLKNNALSIILNFSAIDEETQSRLIDIGLIDLDCINQCFLLGNNNENISFDDFDETLRTDDHDIILIQNDLDSCKLSQIAANFFIDGHAHAIQFAYSLFWKSLIKGYGWFNFNTKQEIARAATLALSFNDEDLITTILSEEMNIYVINAIVECFSNNDLKLEINAIIAIENLVNLYLLYDNIIELNLAFENIVQNGLIDDIEDFMLNKEDEIPNTLIPKIHKILSFFEEFTFNYHTIEDSLDNIATG